jgi:diaminopimelate epimerase
LPLSFTKYHGTGNDFLLIDNRLGEIAFSEQQVKKLCERRFGVGADGLILIEADDTRGSSFYMRYYNSDGSSSFCGNGSRCAVHFARTLDLVQESTRFRAIDGMHKATIDHDFVEVVMADTTFPERIPEGYFVHTGSPHVLIYVDDLSTTDVQKMGALLRYSGRWGKAGTNVNFIERSEVGFRMRTYERGVEAETYSCGTGATAAAITDVFIHGGKERSIETLGGTLRVRLRKGKKGFNQIKLGGLATPVFTGKIEWP